MGMIEREGAYRGVVTDHTLRFTKNGYPMAVLHITATERWVEDKDELEYFELGEPGWQDWGDDEHITAFNVLFNDADEYTEESKLVGYDQLVKALGWDGMSFDALGNGTEFVGTKVFFRTGFDDYSGESKMSVAWLDHEDADPVRQLTPATEDDIKAMQSKLKLKGAAKPVKPSKPSKPVKAEAPAEPEEEAPKPKAKPKAKAKGKVKKGAAAPPKSKRTKPDPTDAPFEDGEDADGGLKEPGSARDSWPDETGMREAWDALYSVRTDQTDQAIEEAWVSAIDEILDGTERTEDDLTPAEWAEVRNAAADVLDM
jgi:hypothetical protein